jgi:methionyl-tRNA formyltransferase
MKFAFLGTSEFSIFILEVLKKAGYIPSLLITAPDKPKGRKLVMTPPLTKVWAEKNDIKVLQPTKLDEEFIQKLKKEEWDLFIVASYGKIIPGEVLDIPKYKSINVHPSLLPELRGPSPIQGMILKDKKNTGVSIMLMDEKMDHGPILAQESVTINEWSKASVLEEKLAKVSGDLLIQVIPNWISGKIKPQVQDHDKATFVKMIKKEDAEIDLNDDDYLNYRKILAYERWPRTFFFKDGKRVIVNEAKFEDGKLEILRVTPEGKKEMDYSLFKNTD